MTIKEQIAVMQAYLDGKSIQYRTKGNSEWERCSFPLWDWATCEYRIKPEPTYRPYKDSSEMVADFKNRFKIAVIPSHCMPLIWVRRKNDKDIYLITDFDTNSVNCISLPNLFDFYTYLDGTPCGKLVEE